MEAADELETRTASEPAAEGMHVQPAGYLIELSLDWIVLRASENIHHLLGESHVTLIDEPLGKFVQSQALHDLRNLFSRLSGTTGIGRAYCVRLTDGRVLLEAVPSAGTFGECFGTVGGLVAGLSTSRGQPLLDGGARRMRALTGYDRVTVTVGDRRAESSRGAFAGPANPTDLPVIITDTGAEGVGLFPREVEETSAHAALMRSLDDGDRQKLQAEGIRAMLRIRFAARGLDCEFCCESRTPREPNFELHAAAELFAQMFALRLEIDQAAKP